VLIHMPTKTDTADQKDVAGKEAKDGTVVTTDSQLQPVALAHKHDHASATKCCRKDTCCWNP
jgi:hypothetical protein